MPHRIVILEDEPDLLLALEVRLQAAGFTCETARNGKVGLEKIRRSAPALIISDLMMPEVDGFEAIQQLREHPETAAIPIIVLTALPQHMVDHHKGQLASVYVIYKPFDFQTLVSMIRELTDTMGSGGPQHG